MMNTRGRIVFVALMGGTLIASPPAWADDLLSLYREAVQADASYLAAQADNRARREVAPQALARLLPNVALSGSRFRNKTEGDSTMENMSNGASSSGDIEYKNNSHNYSLGLKQPIFRPAVFMAWQQAKAQVESVDASLLAAGQEVGTRVGEAYFRVLLAEAELEVTKAQRDAYLTQLEYAQKAFQSGSGTRTDIDEARSQLDLAAAQTIQLQYQLNYAKDALRIIVDRPLSSLSRLDPGRMALDPPDPARLDDWVGMAEEVNPTLRALRAEQEAADKKVKAALSGHLPTLDFVARRSKSKNTSVSYPTKYENEYDKNTEYGIQFEMPLFSGGETQSGVRQAQAEKDKAKQQLEGTRRDVGLQVRKEFDGVAQGVYWVRAYEQAVKSAELALVSTRRGFMGGTRTTLDILTAEQNLANARRDLNRGRYDYVLSRLRLLALVGRLNEEEIGRFNGWLEARQ